MAYSDRELLARIIQCEAGGEGEDGMKAVATVIMNRVEIAVGEYSRISNGGDIRNIIFQENQFDCVRDIIRGMYNSQNIYNMNPTEIEYEIADWALSGNKLNEVNGCLWFYNPFTLDCTNLFPINGTGSFFTRINEHCFYQPTNKYNDT